MASPISVPVGTRASQVWSGRQSQDINSLLLMNTGTTTVMVGSDINSVVVPILANGSLSVDPVENWYVQGTSAGSGPLVVVPNGQSNFLGLTANLGNLAIPSIQSPNFNLSNPGVSPNPSWAVLQNGIAYFVGLMLSGGTITGPDYIINSQGIFIYNGTPANGNLIGSWAGAAGFDQFLNIYPQGLNVTKGAISGSVFNGTDYLINSTGLFFYSGPPGIGNLFMYLAVANGFDPQGNAVKQGLFVGSAASGPNVGFNISAGAAQLIFASNSASFGNSILSTIIAAFAQLQLGGPASTTAGFTDSVGQQWNSSDGASSVANGNLNYLDTAGTRHFYLAWGPNGVSTIANQVNGVHPGTGTRATPAVAEGWQQAAALLNGWQVGGPVPGGVRYCYNPINGGRIDIEVDVFNPSIALPFAASNVFTLPAAYANLVTGVERNFAAMSNYNFANNSPSPNWGFYDGAGNIQVINYQLHVETSFQGFIPLT